MRKIDYIYKNFDPISFSKKIQNYKGYLKGGDKYFLTNIVLDSVRNIDEIKNKINLHEFTSLENNKIYLNFIKSYKNYNNKDIENYFIKKHNIVNDYNSYKVDNYEYLEFLVQEHVCCGEFFRNYKNFFDIIFYAQVTFKHHTGRDNLHFGMYSDFYCLNIKKLNKYYLFQYDYEQDGNDFAYIPKVFSKKPNKNDLIKILRSDIYGDLISKEEIIVNESGKFNYDKSYNRIYSKGYKLRHQIIPHFKNEEDYFNYHNTKGESHIAQEMAISNPEKYFTKYFKNWKQVSSILGGSGRHGRSKIQKKVKDNTFFKFVMSNRFNYRNSIKFIEDIIYSYNDLEGLLNYVPKKIQESKSLKEEIRILRLFRGNNKKFIIKVFQTNKDKLEDLVKYYMPSTIFDDSYLMNELIKLDINFTADIGEKLKKNKKFMTKVNKLLPKK